jgi:hypothetical protein
MERLGAVVVLRPCEHVPHKVDASVAGAGPRAYRAPVARLFEEAQKSCRPSLPSSIPEGRDSSI